MPLAAASAPAVQGEASSSSAPPHLSRIASQRKVVVIVAPSAAAAATSVSTKDRSAASTSVSRSTSRKNLSRATSVAGTGASAAAAASSAAAAAAASFAEDQTGELLRNLRSLVDLGKRHVDATLKRSETATVAPADPAEVSSSSRKASPAGSRRASVQLLVDDLANAAIDAPLSPNEDDEDGWPRRVLSDDSELDHNSSTSSLERSDLDSEPGSEFDAEAEAHAADAAQAAELDSRISALVGLMSSPDSASRTAIAAVGAMVASARAAHEQSATNLSELPTFIREAMGLPPLTEEERAQAMAKAAAVDEARSRVASRAPSRRGSFKASPSSSLAALPTVDSTLPAVEQPSPVIAVSIRSTVDLSAVPALAAAAATAATAPTPVIDPVLSPEEGRKLKASAAQQQQIASPLKSAMKKPKRGHGHTPSAEMRQLEADLFAADVARGLVQPPITPARAISNDEAAALVAKHLERLGWAQKQMELGRTESTSLRAELHAQIEFAQTVRRTKAKAARLHAAQARARAAERLASEAAEDREDTRLRAHELDQRRAQARRHRAHELKTKHQAIHAPRVAPPPNSGSPRPFVPAPRNIVPHVEHSDPKLFVMPEMIPTPEEEPTQHDLFAHLEQEPLLLVQPRTPIAGEDDEDEEEVEEEEQEEDIADLAHDDATISKPFTTAAAPSPISPSKKTSHKKKLSSGSLATSAQKKALRASRKLAAEQDRVEAYAARVERARPTARYLPAKKAASAAASAVASAAASTAASAAVSTTASQAELPMTISRYVDSDEDDEDETEATEAPEGDFASTMLAIIAKQKEESSANPTAAATHTSSHPSAARPSPSKSNANMRTGEYELPPSDDVDHANAPAAEPVDPPLIDGLVDPDTLVDPAIATAWEAQSNSHSLQELKGGFEQQTQDEEQEQEEQHGETEEKEEAKQPAAPAASTTSHAGSVTWSDLSSSLSTSTPTSTRALQALMLSLRRGTHGSRGCVGDPTSEGAERVHPHVFTSQFALPSRRLIDHLKPSQEPRSPRRKGRARVKAVVPTTDEQDGEEEPADWRRSTRAPVIVSGASTPGLITPATTSDAEAAAAAAEFSAEMLRKFVSGSASPPVASAVAPSGGGHGGSPRRVKRAGLATPAAELRGPGSSSHAVSVVKQARHPLAWTKHTKRAPAPRGASLSPPRMLQGPPPAIPLLPVQAALVARSQTVFSSRVAAAPPAPLEAGSQSARTFGSHKQRPPPALASSLARPKGAQVDWPRINALRIRTYSPRRHVTVPLLDEDMLAFHLANGGSGTAQGLPFVPSATEAGAQRDAAFERHLTRSFERGGGLRDDGGSAHQVDLRPLLHPRDLFASSSSSQLARDLDLAASARHERMGASIRFEPRNSNTAEPADSALYRELAQAQERVREAVRRGEQPLPPQQARPNAQRPAAQPSSVVERLFPTPGEEGGDLAGWPSAPGSDDGRSDTTGAFQQRQEEEKQSLPPSLVLPPVNGAQPAPAPSPIAKSPKILSAFANRAHIEPVPPVQKAVAKKRTSGETVASSSSLFSAKHSPLHRPLGDSGAAAPPAATTGHSRSGSARASARGSPAPSPTTQPPAVAAAAGRSSASRRARASFDRPASTSSKPPAASTSSTAPTSVITTPPTTAADSGNVLDEFVAQLLLNSSGVPASGSTPVSPVSSPRIDARPGHVRQPSALKGSRPSSRGAAAFAVSFAL